MVMPFFLLVLSAALCTSAFPSHYRRTFSATNKMNWTAAQAYCRESHTDLATVYSQEEAERILNITTDGSPVWIGLRRSNSSVKWSNGVSVNYTKNTANDGWKEPLCTSMKADGDWENVNCTLERPFMCYNKGDGDHPPSYTLKQEGSSWCEAQRFCRLHHTDLVSISNDTQNEAVKEEGRSSAPFWIGLIHTDWEWSDGACTTFRDWSGVNPTEGKDCVKAGTGQYYHTWIAVDCTGQFQALCYKDEIHVIEMTQTWEDALNHCNQNYEGFLRIESPQDQRRLEEELHKNNLSGPVWLGLRQSRLFGFWIWANGMNVGWSNWEEGSQPEQPLSHICGAIATSGPGKFKWSDQNCLSKSYFLCEGDKR